MANDSYDEMWDDILDVTGENHQERSIDQSREDEPLTNNLIFCNDCDTWCWFLCPFHSEVQDGSWNEQAKSVCEICSVNGCTSYNHQLNVLNDKRIEKICSCDRYSLISSPDSTFVENSISDFDPTDSEIMDALDELDHLEGLNDDEDRSEGSNFEDQEEDFYETVIYVDDPNHYFTQSMSANFGVNLDSSSSSPFSMDLDLVDEVTNSSEISEDEEIDNSDSYDDGYYDGLDSCGEDYEDEDQEMNKAIRHYCVTGQY